MAEPPRLKRAIGLPALVFFGMGTMVGGGFYALLGEVAHASGMLAPLSLGCAGVVALINGLAFAELSSRYPVSAGEARYVSEGLNARWLAALTGWLVILTGVVSSATLAVATVGFLRDLITINETVAIIGLVLGLGLLAAWGVGESVATIVAITFIEVGTLLVILFINAPNLAELPAQWRSVEQPTGSSAFAALGVFSGAFLAFYAFIGFEDMVNMAEEVKRPRSVLPKAIVISVIATTVLYVVVALAGVATVDPQRLVDSRTPIAELVPEGGRFGAIAIGIVSLLTGVNGALVQIIMAARVGYGLAHQRSAPQWLGRVNRMTRTPVLATAVMTAVILALALFFPLSTLAQVTSAIILVVFALVNLSLWRIKGANPDPDGEGPRYPRWVPLLGFVTCAAVLAGKGWMLAAGAG